MLTSLLIANRGEIACRIMRTARRLGVRTVAVYSDADARALHVRQADEAVLIGPSPAAESYLRGDRIIAAAKATKAEAIHPGYGFLSENADFAQQVIDAGLVWVGPKPASIRAMGLKDAAKARMAAAGVPVTPGYLGEDQAPDRLAQEAAAIGYPVLVKAVAGGGGKGMRKVEVPADFADALASAKREAAAAFGNDHVLIEKWITSPRHIEVQVFGDSHGNVVHLFERDCSLQRRHQKVIEEAPAPGMDAETREAVCGAAVRAAQAVDYEGAGTIEFIADASEGLRADRVWFMEMNTRLQVEHPVTEEITGVDLVEWQLRVASGEPLPLRQEELSINGWAMEARLYAEDPANGFLPSVGRLEKFHIPMTNRRDGSIRVETGVEEGSEISPYYDPMIAKLIVHRSTRDEAAKALGRRLGQGLCWPVKWNAGFLRNLVLHTEFLDARLDTGFIDRHLAEVLPPVEPPRDVLEAAAVLIALQARGVEIENTTDLYPKDVDTFFAPSFRLNSAPHKTSVRIKFEDDIFDVTLTGSSVWDLPMATVVSEGVLAYDYKGWSGLFQPFRSDLAGHHAASDGTVLSPMPGKITAVEVVDGQAVAKGDTLIVMEAMKMEQGLTAPFDGTVADLAVSRGDQVKERVALVRVVAAGD